MSNEVDLMAQQNVDYDLIQLDQNCMRHVRIANIIRLHAQQQAQMQSNNNENQEQ